jgi:hypothetical protein
MTSVLALVSASSASVTGAPFSAVLTASTNAARLSGVGLTMIAGASGGGDGGDVLQAASEHKTPAIAQALGSVAVVISTRCGSATREI